MDRTSDSVEPIERSDAIENVSADAWRPDSQTVANENSSAAGEGEPDELEIPDIYAQTVTQSPDSEANDEPEANDGHDEANGGHEDEWTVVVDLAASENIGSQQQPVLSAEDKAEQLRELAAATEDKPIDIFVQLVAEQENGENVLERYEIEDGQITELPQQPAEDFASDIESLLQTATANSDSEKIALILQAHGGGTRGMTGDDNEPGQVTSSPELVEAINNGLAGSEHDRIDVLDLDGCLMAEAGFLEYADQVTDHLVASAETTRARAGGVNSQNLNAVLENLIENPEMDAGEFADSIVSEAAAGSNAATDKRTPDAERTRYDNGTNTLAHFNLENYEQFEESYNVFGNSLADAVQDPQNKEVIERLIDDTHKYGMESSAISTDKRENRDLQTFVESVRQSIESGELTDESGALMRSANELLQQQDAMTESYFGDRTSEGYDEMGGLSTFLPSEQWRDSEATASTLTDIGQFGEVTRRYIDRLDDGSVTDANVRSFVAGINAQAPSVLRPERADDATLDPLRDFLQNELSTVQTVDELRSALDELDRINDELFNSELNEELARELLPGVIERRETVYDYESAAGNEGWNRFIEALAS